MEYEVDNAHCLYYYFLAIIILIVIWSLRSL